MGTSWLFSSLFQTWWVSVWQREWNSWSCIQWGSCYSSQFHYHHNFCHHVSRTFPWIIKPLKGRGKLEYNATSNIFWSNLAFTGVCGFCKDLGKGCKGRLRRELTWRKCIRLGHGLRIKTCEGKEEAAMVHKKLSIKQSQKGNLRMTDIFLLLWNCPMFLHLFSQALRNPSNQGKPR